MCEGVPAYKPTAKEAADELTKLIARQLNVHIIDPVALRLFIQAYWSRVQLLAHAIHDDR